MLNSLKNSNKSSHKELKCSKDYRRNSKPLRKPRITGTPKRPDSKLLNLRPMLVTIKMLRMLQIKLSVTMRHLSKISTKQLKTRKVLSIKSRTNLMVQQPREKHLPPKRREKQERRNSTSLMRPRTIKKLIWLLCNKSSMSNSDRETRVS